VAGIILTGILTSFSLRPGDTIHATGILIDIILILSYCTTSHYYLESCTNNLTKYIDLLTGSYSRLSLRPVSSTPPSCYHTHRIILIPSMLPASSLTSYASYHIVMYNFPLSVTWRAVLTISRRTSIFSLHQIDDCPCSQHHPHLHPNIVLIVFF